MQKQKIYFQTPKKFKRKRTTKLQTLSKHSIRPKDEKTIKTKMAKKSRKTQRRRWKEEKKESRRRKDNEEKARNPKKTMKKARSI